MNLISSDFTDLPMISESLVKALENRFPARCQELTESQREHDRYAGKVELIQFLRLVMNKKLQTKA